MDPKKIVGEREDSRLRAHPGLPYRPDIDGIRALAVISIVVYHAFPALVRGGFVGVDIFFVISGYLITLIIVTNLDCGKFSFADFYKRRIKRIFPALVFILIVCYAFGWFTLLADEYALLGKQIAAAAGFVLNFELAREAGYFDVASELKPVLHLWSLAVEEQFYLVWPLLLLLAYRLRLNLLGGMVVLALISFIANAILVTLAPVEDFYLPFTRAWELASGGILAILVSRDELAPARAAHWRNAASVAGLFAIGAALFGPTQPDAYPGWWALLPVSGTILLIASGGNAWFNRTVLSHKLAIWFGLISYPLYLWHWPLLSYLAIVDTEAPPPSFRFLALIVSVALAWLTYRLIERPARMWGGGAVPVCLCVLVAGMGSIGYVTYAHDGLKSRLGHGLAFRLGPGYETLINSIEVGKDYGAGRIGACANSQLGKDNCLEDERGPATAVVFGDSKAEALYPGLVRNSAQGPKWMAVWEHGCSPFSGAEPVENAKYRSVTSTPWSDCKAFLDKAIGEIEKNSELKTVVIATSRRLLDTQITAESSTEKDRQIALLVAGLLNTVNELKRDGKRIVFMIDNPVLAQAKECLPNRFFAADEAKSRCSVKLPEYLADEANYLTLVRRLEAASMIQVFDPTDALCAEGTCSVIRDGKSLYSVTDHLSDYGNDIVGKKLLLFLGD